MSPTDRTRVDITPLVEVSLTMPLAEARYVGRWLAQVEGDNWATEPPEVMERLAEALREAEAAAPVTLRGDE